MSNMSEEKEKAWKQFKDQESITIIYAEDKRKVEFGFDAGVLAERERVRILIGNPGPFKKYWLTYDELFPQAGEEE